MEALLRGGEALVWLGGAAVIGILGHFLLLKTAALLARRTQTVLDDSLVRRCRGPARVIIPLLLVHYALPLIAVSRRVLLFLKQALGLLLIGSIAWLIIKLSGKFTPASCRDSRGIIDT
jgi:hypothetical protein